MTQWRWIRCACLALFLAVVLAGGPRAVGGSPVEELTKRLPDGVVGFVATSGGGVLKGDFAKTALGKIWNDPNVRSFYQSAKTGLLAKVKQQVQDPNAPQMADMVMQYAQLVLGRPLVVGVAQIQAKNGPPVCVFAIVDAGDRKADLAAAVSKLEAEVGEDEIADIEVGSLKMHRLKDEDDMPLYWGWVDSHLVVTMNDAQGAVAKYLASPRAAAASCLSKVPAGDDALVAYCDYQKLGQLLGALARKDGGEKHANMVGPLFKGLGIGDAKLAVRVGFAGSDVVARAFFELPTPAAGVFTAHKPIDPSWFGAVDVRAVTASAVNVDAASLYDMLLNVVKTVSPDEGYPEVQKAIAGFESEAKLRVREGLLASLAGPALFYSLPVGTIPDSPRGGFVVVAKLKDAPLFEKTMLALGEFAGSRGKGSLQITPQTREGGRTVQVWTIASLMMLGVTPAWSIANDHVVIGSSVELCDLGVKQLASKGADGKSLLDAEGYKKIAAGLPKDLVCLTYTDSRAQLTQTMMQIQQVWPIATMFAMQAGLKLPVMLPSLTGIARDLGPSCSYRYFGPDGLHAYYRGPGIEVSEGAIAGAAVGAAVAMPAIAKARQQAGNAVAMSNLKQIGLGLIMYADDHQGDWPADLEQAKSYFGSSAILDAPRKPKDFNGPSYVYVRGQTKTADHRNIVVYENPEFCTDKINVLFLDGHVEAMKPEAFRRELKATYERLGKETPEIKFKGEVEVKPRAPRPARPSKAAQA